MPLVGFGCAGLGARGEKAVLNALQAGFRHVDTAQATEWYDEAAVGRAIKASGVPQNEIFVTTKVHPKNFGYERTLASIDESLAALGLAQIDLLLLHTASCAQWGDICPPDADGTRGTFYDAWSALEDAYDQGKVRAIGVSNFDVYVACPLAPALVEIRCPSCGLTVGLPIPTNTTGTTCSR